ncbi:MAG: hypothetical protein EB060_00440 [Proteobacteria bacterium]|nr:hypothetical protein [Pseudomonadota bacterium]
MFSFTLFGIRFVASVGEFPTAENKQGEVQVALRISLLEDLEATPFELSKGKPVQIEYNRTYDIMMRQNASQDWKMVPFMEIKLVEPKPYGEAYGDMLLEDEAARAGLDIADPFDD